MPVELAPLPPLDASRFAEEIAFHLRYTLGLTPAECTAYDLFRVCAMPLRQRLMDGLDRHRAPLSGEACPARLLSLGRVPHRPLAQRHAPEHGAARRRRGRAPRRWASTSMPSWRASPMRRSATAASAGSPPVISSRWPSLGPSRLRLRHQLRIRSLQAGNRRRRPGRAAGHSGTRSSIPGRSSGPTRRSSSRSTGASRTAATAAAPTTRTWLDWKVIVGVPHDIPVVGDGGRTVNWLRLFSARGSSEFDVQIFNAGDYIRAVEQKISSETISKVLYPSDTVAAGQGAAAASRSTSSSPAPSATSSRARRKTHGSIDALPDAVAIQMNDTHPVARGGRVDARARRRGGRRRGNRRGR